MLERAESTAAAWATGSIVVVISRPSVLSSCSLIPASPSSRRTWFLIRPSGPESWLPLSTCAIGTYGGYCITDRADCSRVPADTMPSST